MNKADYLENQLGLFDSYECPIGGDDSSYGRTCLVLLQADRSVVLILEPCLKQSQKPIFQCLKMEDGQTPEWFNAQSVKLRGERLMLNIGEFPNEENESSLSQILQNPADVPQKYYLSAKACREILNRAAKRGKELPEQLKRALEYQAKMSTGGGQIYDIQHRQDVVRVYRGKSPTLTASAGTGGNNVPIVLNDQGGQSKASNNLNSNNVVRQQYAVRRLTPLEFERLQGLPDEYTLIDDKSCSDSARYKALGNGMAQPCANFIIKRIVEELQNEEQ